MVDLAARLNKDGIEFAASPVSAGQLGGLVARIADQTISNNIAKKVFDALWAGEGTTADEIIERYIKTGELVDGIIPKNYESIN